MEAYLELVRKIMQKGVRVQNRTGVDTLAIFGEKFEHDMAEGFPLVTTKKVIFQSIFSELEFFIKGLTDKRWLQERGNPIWDAWGGGISYAHDEETKWKMLEEADLGPIYGFQWRHFGAVYRGLEVNYTGQGVDQLADLINTIKTKPTDRRMIVSAWNPAQLHLMALPPCHYQFQVNISEDKLNLAWTQRSVDTMLGLPFNIASYATLLHLLAKETGYKEGKLVGFFGDTHMYVNHLEGAEKQLSRKLFPLPAIETKNFTSIFDWRYIDTEVLNYQHHPFIKYPIAV